MKTIRSHVVGSMLRPEGLLDSREQVRSGTLTSHEFRVIEDRAVDRAIPVQEAARIEVITDGEQRPSARRRWGARMGGEEYSYARARASHPVKVTLPSPTVMISAWSPEHSTVAYANPADLVDDFAAALRDEILHLAELGCEYVQLDALELTFLVGDGSAFGVFEAAGMTREAFLENEINILNGIASVPGVTFGVHLFGGNKENEWHWAGGYEAISKELFPRLERFDYLLFKLDDERSGGFEPLADVPDDTCVVFGLVSTKRAEVEDHDVLMWRIDDAARFHPREELAVSPECGFASISFGNPIGQAAEQAILGLVGQLGREAWN